MNVILINLFNKYNTLIILLFLYYSKDASDLKVACGNIFVSLDKVMTAISLNDSRLYI